MPPADDRLATLPAQPDLAAGDEGREVDETVLDIAQRQTETVDPGDAGRHLVDQPLHPEPGETQVVDDRLIAGSRRLSRAGGFRKDGVAEPDELGALLDEHGEDPVELGDGGIGGVDVVEPGHRRDSSPPVAYHPNVRSILLWAARNRWLKERLPRLRFMRRAVRRFMPGETFDDALAAALPLQAAGIASMYTRLGENLENLAAADEVADHYLPVVDEIVAARIDGEISVKPTQLGLDLDPEACLAHLVRIAEHAAAAGSYLWIDMEGSAYVDATLDLYERLRVSQPRTGICLQSYLRRTPDDLERLRPLDPAIRLVKGAYEEKASIAFKDRRSVDAAYLGLAVGFLLGGRDRPIRLGLGTHDVKLIEQIAAQVGAGGIGRDGFEVQMLYGIRTDQQLRLVKAGYRVRSLIAYGEHWYPWYMRRLAERPANIWFALRQMLP